MVEVLEVFAAMDRAMAQRGFHLERDHYDPESFGYRSRLYRKDATTAVGLEWEARDYWFILHGGTPWRDLAIYRGVRESRESPAEIVGILLKEAGTAI